MNSKIEIIYFDMDGVLSDWEKAFKAHFPETELTTFAGMSEKQKEPYNEVMKKAAFASQ